MMILMLAFFAGLVSVWICYYLRNFLPKLNQEVYQAYQQLFKVEVIALTQLDCRYPTMKYVSFKWHCICFVLLALLLNIVIENPIQVVSLLGYSALSYVIARIDFAYQLIPPQLCQCLFGLGLFSAEYAQSPLSLIESLQSAVLGLMSFYLIYQGAKYFYKQEALGRGDYWLMLGLGSFTPVLQISLLVFLACLVGLLYWVSCHLRGHKLSQLSFGPFLIFACTLLLLLNHIDPSMIPVIFQIRI